LRFRVSSLARFHVVGWNKGMKLHALATPLYESLDQSIPASFDAEWAVWGDIGDLAFPTPTGRNLLLVTADDTEPRLLADPLSQRLIPYAALPWICGGAIPRSLVTPQTQTWGQAITAADGVTWFTAVKRPADTLRPALAPKPWKTASAAVRSLIQAALPRSSTAEVVALEAGWRQLFDDLDGSHRCSQSIEGDGRHQSGDYWHAIMHRREPDYGNSQYWFHQFATHPVFAGLPEEAKRIATEFASPKFADWLPRLMAGGRWDPMAFVSCCQAAASSPDAAFRAAVEELQYRELLLLLRQTIADATV
jgi:hypothetical protein